ncbi:hypothetical protein [Mahella australiensis]|uniref:Uncharacterized protein n=1 Tax=Mahella australiensis (strain DSM 15567 / CIP 107919 / 50-1 BON) TaxID=697281 RepID=F3ZZF6_MAHA5|nr:hypothetical protein [Mahella australiensis]AEE95766.1 hypothetical protein Mahau_0562 [Mahella australiensis 50-1 BON]
MARITVWLNNDTMEWYREQATQKGKSISQYISEALEANKEETREILEEHGLIDKNGLFDWEAAE